MLGARQARSRPRRGSSSARSRDAAPILPQEPAQLDDVRLACRMANLGDARARRRPRAARSRCRSPRLRRDRSNAGLRPSGASSPCPAPSSRRARPSPQRVEMRVDRAARREVAARRREARAAAAREQRAEQQHGAAQPADERRSGSSFITVGHRTRSVVVPMPSTSAPRSSSRRAITSTSRDARHVGEDALLRRSAGTRPAAAARRSCCLRPRRDRRGAGRLQ